MLKVFICEASKGLKIKTETERSKIMDRYAQLKSFHHEYQPQN